MITDIARAGEQIADAIWWFKGFAAANVPACGMMNPDNDASSLAEQLREIRIFLDRIKDGKVRRLGEEKAIVLTYAEFERIYDYVAHPRAGEAEKADAVLTIRQVLDDYHRERRDADAQEPAF
jgi:hypothetical protein